jgi:hypothetical protein
VVVTPAVVVTAAVVVVSAATVVVVSVAAVVEADSPPPPHAATTKAKIRPIVNSLYCFFIEMIPFKLPEQTEEYQDCRRGLWSAAG